MEGTIYDDFGEGYNDTHGSLTLGYALVFNHVGAKEDKMVEKFSTGWVSMYFANGEESTDGHYEAARDVAKGEQIFSYYGDDWFDYRTFDEISPAAVGEYYLKMADPFHGPTRVPGCPTTTLKVTNSPTPPPTPHPSLLRLPFVCSLFSYIFDHRLYILSSVY